jgi:Holliday junction resolvase
MVNSRAKGAAGERELANRLKELGLTARRGQQFCGANGDSDVVCEELASYHIECKRVQALNIHQAISQAVRDGKGSKTPVVIHRKNGTPWLATIFLEDFIALAVKPPTSEPSQ